MGLDVAPVDGVHPELGLLFATWADSTREWREMVEWDCPEPPAPALAWQMYEGGPSIGGLLLHMAGCEAFWFERLVCGKEPDLSDPVQLYSSKLDIEGGVWPVPPSESYAWFLDLYERRRKRSIEIITERNDPTELFQHRLGEMTMRWIVAHVIEHDSYHGGQIVMLYEAWKRLQGPAA